MSATVTTKLFGLNLLNNSIGYLGTGSTLANLNSAASSSELNAITKAMSLTGNGLVLGSTALSMFSNASQLFSVSVSRANVAGQTLILGAHAADAVIKLNSSGGYLTNADIANLVGDISGLLSSGLLAAITTAQASGATTVAVAGLGVISLPAALGIAAAAGGIALVLSYGASNMDPSTASIWQGIQKTLSDSKNIFASTFVLPDLSVSASSAPNSRAISADGKTVTTIYTSTVDSYTVVQAYTDGARSTLVSDQSIDRNLATGVTTTTTVNYNPTDPNGACTFSTIVTSANSTTPISTITGSTNNSGVTTETISGNGAVSSASNAIINITAGSTVTLTGTDNVVNAANSQINLGADASATITGTGNTVNSTNSQLTLGDGSSVTITGSGNTITVGKDASVTVNSGTGSNAINEASHYTNQNPANDWHWLSDMLINTVAA